MSPDFIPHPLAIVIIYHNRVDIFRRSECLPGPPHTSELVLGRVACVHVLSLPFSDKMVWADGLEIFECRLDIFGIKILAGNQFLIMLFWGAINATLLVL